MNNDNAIKYNAKLTELKNNLDKVSKMGMKIYDFNNKIEVIEKEVNDKIKDNYDKFFDGKSDVFLNDSLSKIYEEAIKKIDRINEYVISQYDDYYKINNKCIELNNSISNINSNNIDDFVAEVKTLLRKMKSSSCIDYQEEKVLVDDVYDLVYRTIKLELMYNKQSELIGEVKSDDVDSTYIAELVKQDIDAYKDSDYLKNAILKVESKGLRSNNYIDEELIFLLATTNNPDVIINMQDEFLEKYAECDEIITQMNNINTAIDEFNDDIIYFKNQKRIENKKILSGINRIAINVGAIALMVVGSIHLAKHEATEIKYNTVTEVYDDYTGDTEITNDYQELVDHDVTITEYTPWGEFRNMYYRDVSIYSVDDSITYENLKDYLNIDASKLSKVSENKESIDLILDGAKYEDTKYIVTRYSQDQDDSITEVNEGNYIGWIALSIFISLLAEVTLFVLSFYHEMPSYYFNKNGYGMRIKGTERDLLKLKNDLIKLNKQFMSLKKDILRKYEELPLPIKNQEEITNKILRLEDKNIND